MTRRRAKGLPTRAAPRSTFLWIGQILYPTFINEMKRPQDFPKALYALTIAEVRTSFLWTPIERR